jgi:Recombinase
VAHYRVYVRYSDKHSAQGSSEERQWDIERHRERAAELEAKLGEKIELVEVPYVDRAESGFHGDNLEAELGRIKADIQSGAIPKRDILCAEAHDRLGRLRPGEAVMQYLGFLRDGIRLDIKGVLRSWQSINGEQGLPTLMNDFIEIFVAYQESLKKQKHARDTNQIKRKKLRAGTQQGVMRSGTAGWFVGRRCPAWVRPVQEPVVIEEHVYLYEIVESVASVIRLIFDLRESGIGCYVIAQRLEAMGDEAEPLRNAHIVNPEKKHKGGWSQTMVARILRDETVIGRYQPKIMQDVMDEDGEPIRGKRIAVEDGKPAVDKYYPRIIEPAQFWKVRKLVEQSNTTGGGKGRTGKEFGNIVRGIGRCICCDGPVNKNGNSYKYLKCENARRRVIFPDGHKLAGQKCPNIHGFAYGDFEAALFSLFRPAMIPVLAEMIPQKHRDDLVARRLDDCEAKVAEHEQGIKRLARMVAKAEDDETADAYDSEIKLIRIDLNRLRVERDRLRQQSISHVEKHEEQIAAVIAKLHDASNPQARYDARAKLNQLLANHIGLTLNNDRTITVRINAHSGLNPVDARLTHDGLDSIDVIDRDGTVLTHFDRAGLVLLEPIIQAVGTDDRTPAGRAA